MKVSVKIKRSGKGFRSVADAIPSRASAVVRDATFAGEASAKTYVAVLSGTLRRSIHGEMETNYRGAFGTPLDYGPSQEYGTVDMPAHPFIHPALDDVRPKFKRDLKAILK